MGLPELQRGTMQLPLAAAVAAAILCAALAVPLAHSDRNSEVLPAGVFRPSQFNRLQGPHARIVQGNPPGYNETYGYPDGIGGLIIEGPFPYKNGPSVWSDDNRWGAYGLIVAPGTLSDDGKCTPLPSDSPFTKTKLHPVPLTNGIKDCEVGCDLKQVEKTGVDPCRIASLDTPLSDSPMSCFNVGDGMAGGWGVCGYNCTAFQHESTDKLVP